MAVETVVLDTRNAARLLGRIARELSGRGRRAKDALEALGVAALNDIRKDFIERSRPGHPFWPRMGFVTAILRTGGRKIYGESDVEARRDTLLRLRSSGLLLDSLSRGDSANVFREGVLEVEVGTRDRRAALLHHGGRTRFLFTTEMEKRFEKNVSKTLPGFRKPRALKSGRRRKWKARGKTSPWNPFYFIMIGAMRKWSRTARSFKVPARPIITRPDDERLRRYARIVERFLAGPKGAKP